jgi:hypothetical protein
MGIRGGYFKMLLSFGEYREGVLPVYLNQVIDTSVGGGDYALPNTPLHSHTRD